MTRRPSSGESGFTLLEVLCALLISALVMTGLTATMRTIDRGWRATVDSIGRQEMMATALRVAAADIARIERVVAAGGLDYEFAGTSSEMVYVLNERPEGGAAGLYLVRLLARGGEPTTLERATTPYRSDAEPEQWGADAVLLRGNLAVEFSYRAPSAGMRDWRSRWIDEGRLPEQVRIEIRDRRTGQPLLPAMIQSLKISADAACVDPEAGGCTLRTQGRLRSGDG